MKEYERTSTTVVNAYLLATMRDYLQRLRSRPSRHRRQGADPGHDIQRRHVGGRCDLRKAGAWWWHPGPAGGVVGAARLGIARNDRDVIVFDMGGTTAKAVIIEDGRPTHDVGI